MNTQFPSVLKVEFANSLTHALGILFGIIAVPLMIAYAVEGGNAAGIVGVCIYGFSFLMVFTASTLYHGVTNPGIKNALRVVDHISIYFMIAGTYTPFILYNLFDSRGITTISILWSVVLLGIVYKLFFINKYRMLSLCIYLAMGWAVAFLPWDFFSELSTASLVLIIVGGALYSVGAWFYAKDKWMYSHTIWHVMVLAASICHYVAIFLII